MGPSFGPCQRALSRSIYSFSPESMFSHNSLIKSGRRGRRGSGFALVLTLFVIVILSILLVGLLFTAKNELNTVVLQGSSLDSRIAADSVIQIVQGQIRQATVEGLDLSATATEEKQQGTAAWASQPGAIRVYDGTGAPDRVFKLYSSDQMIVEDAASLTDGSEIPLDWRQRENEFVDLNEPVNRWDAAGLDQWIFPIASPETLGAVAGFDTTLERSVGARWDDRLVMPVRWLYLLEDGSITADPTAGNPVLRVAFWTDDESAKINLNTASATDKDSYWDFPRATFREERDRFGLNQPAQNEFNRYPGHPATVSLKTVFNTATIKDIIEASPRYSWGGSENGSIPIPFAGAVSARTPLDNSKVDRLFATPDELFYNPKRKAQLGLDAPSLDSRRFFITTSSHSSDLNLFGQPRVTIWPIPAEGGASYRTPFDELIAFCSTVGNRQTDPTTKESSSWPYYFVRKAPYSQTHDWTAYPRNQSLFNYLQTLTGRSIPGFGGNFLKKYDTDSGGTSGERDQILAEIFDYIRCTNLNDTYQNQSSGFNTYTTKMRGTDGSAGAAEATDVSMKTYSGAGWVLPIKITDSSGGVIGRGAGRVPVISEVALWFIQTQEPDGSGGYRNPATPKVQPGLMIETFSPMHGFMTWNPHQFSYEVRNITAPKIDGRPLFLDGETPSFYHSPASSFSRSQSTGGIDGWGWMLGTGISSYPFPISSNPFLTKASDAFDIAGSQIVITGGEIEISFKAGATPPAKGGVPFQTYRIKIPDMTVPIPTAVKPSAGDIANTAANGWYTRKVNGNVPFTIRPEDVVRGIAIRDGDFRSLAYLESVDAAFFQQAFEPNWNDAAIPRVHGLRSGHTTYTLAFLGTENGGYVNAPYAVKVPTSIPADGGYWISARPKINSLIADLRSAGWEGDYDNGVGGWVDGPYLNKPDEGTRTYNADMDDAPPYYFSRWRLGDGLFSPTRQVPSAVMFGSLPTGVRRTAAAYASGNPSNARPWRTLNFAPNPLAKTAHYGMAEPRDHLLLDLFTLPVAEPYAISEPFSTAGRLNLNYQIVPFTHIKRSTPMHAALASQEVIALANADAVDYKTTSLKGNSPPAKKIRYPVNVEETLKQFETDYFSKNKIFRSASEICDLFLVPGGGSGATAANVSTWWDGYGLTGNNSREKPYAALYPLLTTRSNTYTTHLRVQVIKRLRGSSVKFAIVSEYRGSALFERYFDPNDARFKDGSVDPDKVSLEPYFRFRTLVIKQFDP